MPTIRAREPNKVKPWIAGKHLIMLSGNYPVQPNCHKKLWLAKKYLIYSANT